MPTVVTAPTSGWNSFVSIVEADAYFDTRPHSEVWEGAALDDQQRAVIHATRLLNATFTWMTAVGVTEFPTRLKEATAEFALHLIATDRMGDNEVVRQGLTQLKAGSVDLKFRENLDDYDSNDIPNIIPDAVKRLLLPEWYLVPDVGPEYYFKVV
jgi:hypothetical protein